MSFIKIGETLIVDEIKNHSEENPIIEDSVIDDFKKTAQSLKKLAPKAKDFLYFVATIIHAAEASTRDSNGDIKIAKDGKPVKASWDNKWKWVSNDPSIKPYKNHNGDIFPESELLACSASDEEQIPAYKKWVGKPLCIDHKSSSVDHVRGFIVDTYYDHSRKRVIALCALDKVNYPDLARKVVSGYSSNVSMGTSVSTAVCTDCYKQAKVEADFCHHMRSKSAYGEINLGLNPIELSIVVTPADPKATIKHVIASMQNYVQLQEQRLNKLSSSSPDMIAALESLKQETQSISSKIEKIIDETMHNQESSGEEDISTSIADSDLYSHTDDSDVGDSTLQLSSINDRLANSEMDRFKQVTASMEAQLRSMEDKINTLSNIIIEKEKEMSDKSQNKTAYFQGGGGVNEPTPGKPKYEKEKMNEDLREEDKHMQVDDMGGRDGLHPGPKSVGMDELDRKKMLARASMEERYLRRKAALEGAQNSLQTQSWYQGTTEPTPGKKQYPVDPLDGQARKLDKHMHGQKPFPDMGKTDGLHPSPDSADESDELKRKQKLLRASYKARFHKAASQGESSWEVLDGDQVVLSATVNEITGDKADLMFDVVATREFGQKLIDKVKVAGASSVKSLFKKAQAPMAPPEELSEGSGTMQAAAPEASAEVTPEASGTMPAQDLGGDGDPKAELEEALTQIQDLSSDALEAYRTLSGEQKEMGDLGMAQMGTTASSRSLFAIRKDLHSELLGSFKTACAELRDYEVELTSIANTYKRGIRKEAKFVVDSTARDALADAKTAIAETCELMEGFVKYMRASTVLMRRAQEESQYGDDMSSDDDLMAMIDETDSDLADVKEMMADDGVDPMMSADDDDMDSDDEETSSSDDSQDADFSYAEDESDAEDCESSDEMDADISVQGPDGKTTKVPAGPGTKVTMADYDLTSKAGREAYRAKLASDTIKASPMLDIAHPKGAYKPDLSTDSGGYEDIETLDEVHDAMMDMALRQPKVKKEAEVIRQLISEGSIEESELEALVAEGLDKDAVAYYKKMWGSVEGGSEFSSELVKEHAKASIEKDLEVHKAKMARAYNLAHKMAARGFFQNTEAQIASQVDELMRFSDHDFESVKRMIEQKQPVVKTAMPQVGVTNGYADSAPAQGSGSLQDELDQVFSSPKIGRGSW